MDQYKKLYQDIQIPRRLTKNGWSDLKSQLPIRRKSFFPSYLHRNLFLTGGVFSLAVLFILLSLFIQNSNFKNYPSPFSAIDDFYKTNISEILGPNPTPNEIEKPKQKKDIPSPQPTGKPPHTQTPQPTSAPPLKTQVEAVSTSSAKLDPQTESQIEDAKKIEDQQNTPSPTPIFSPQNSDLEKESKEKKDKNQLEDKSKETKSSSKN